MIALDIPEIRDHLAQYLDTRDLYFSALVCRDWQESFTPFLYRTCSIAATSKRNPSQETLEKYAHCVQVLRVSGFVASLDYYQVPCTNLHTLALGGNWGMSFGLGVSSSLVQRRRLPVRRLGGSTADDDGFNDGSSNNNDGTNNGSTNSIGNSSSIDISELKAVVASEFSSTVADLVLRNPKLVHIVFQHQPCISSIKLWNALTASPKLSSMELTNCTIAPADTPAFWEACSKTETLHLFQLKLPKGEEFYPPMKAPLAGRELLLSTNTDPTTTKTIATATTISTTPATATPGSLSSSSLLSSLSEHSTLSISSLSLPSNLSTSSVSPSCSNNSIKKEQKALFSRLQILRMSGVDEGFRIIAQAPLLRSWQWSLGDKMFPYYDLGYTLPRLKPFRFLRDLSINAPQLDDDHIEELLDRMTDAQDINLDWTGFAMKSLQVLMIRHSVTLRSLHLVCKQIQSKEIQTLLTTCSGLEDFGANVLLGTELVLFGAPTKEGSETNEVDFTSPDYNYNMSTGMHKRPLGSGEGTLLGDDWVCLGLKSLVLNFALGGRNLLLNNKNPESLARLERQRGLEQEHTFRQLSRLTQLEKLQMINLSGETPYPHGVNLKLKAKGGRLEDLAALTKLDTINFAGTKQWLEEDEVTWMWDNLPQLMFIMGTFNQDPAVNSRVAAVHQARQHAKW